MSNPVDYTMRTVTLAPGAGRVVQIDAKDGPKLLLRLEMSTSDFLEALIDGTTIVASLSMGGRP